MEIFAMQVAYAALTASLATKSAICKMSLKRDFELETEYAVAISSITPNKYEGVYSTFPPLEDRYVNDHSLSFTKEYELQYLVEKIRRTITRASSKYGYLEELIMIDAIQRLALEDNFREEIQTALGKQYAKLDCSLEYCDYDLYEVALRFRLLRQYGYNTSADIFNKFKDNDGNFKQELCYDKKGLFSLYEASQLGTQGEDILDKASEFCAQLLKASLMDEGTRQSNTQVTENILRNPYHKNLARIMAKSFLHNFEVNLGYLYDINVMNDWMNEVQNLARLEFDVAKATYRNEMCQLSRWEKELTSAKELELARIEPIKWFTWSLGTFPGTNMTHERVELAKVVSFVYIIDDIFDVYGTLDELCLFTEAINRWECADAERLPNYMKVCFKALQKQTYDFSCNILRKHGWNPEESLRKVWAEMCNAFLNEAKWFVSKDLPSSKEYLENGIVSSALHVVLAHAFFLVGQGVNRRTVDELNSLPSIVASTATIVRLWNDVGTDKDENRDGTDGSYIDCYMKEHGCSLGCARKHVSRMISDAWKCLNEEYMSPTSPFSTDFKSACLNFARMVPIVYSHDESHHLESVTKLFYS